MKIYNAMVNDRHIDPSATPFTKLEDAISYAKKEAEDNSNNYPDGYEETSAYGFLFHAIYSCEGDSVWVTEHEIDVCSIII